MLWDFELWKKSKIIRLAHRRTHFSLLQLYTSTLLNILISLGKALYVAVVYEITIKFNIYKLLYYWLLYYIIDHYIIDYYIILLIIIIYYLYNKNI